MNTIGKIVLLGVAVAIVIAALIFIMQVFGMITSSQTGDLLQKSILGVLIATVAIAAVFSLSKLGK